MEIIYVDNLTKKYTNHKKDTGTSGLFHNFFRRKNFEVTAVDRIGFSIDSGEVVGFLGPNGAGKTTTLKMLTGILWPTQGTAMVLNYVPWQRYQGFRSQIAMVMGQKGQLEWDLPAIDSFELNKSIYEIDDGVYRAQMEYLTEILAVKEFIKQPVRTLSLGQRMKLEFICALLHKPKILFLDEPTLGLDLESQKVIHDFIRDYNQATGATVILTSHYMNDIERLCNRLLIINNGKVLHDGNLKDIKNRFSKYKVICVGFQEEIHTEIPLWFGEIVEKGECSLKIKVPIEDVQKAIVSIKEIGTILSLSVEEEAIEDIIIEAFKSEETK